MGRRKNREDEHRLRNFLIAVGDHPWARPGLIQAYGGLGLREFNCVTQLLALEYGLVERADIPSEKRAPRRFGLTPAGAALLGQRFSPALLRNTLLGAMKMDLARQLLEEWFYEPGLVWAISPYVLSTAHLKPPSQKKRWGRQSNKEEVRDKAYRTLRLDGLACVRFADGKYLNVALMVDPGDIRLDWFYHQFRSAHAWCQRYEFRGRLVTFPLWVVIAATEQRGRQMIALWRESASQLTMPQDLRVMTEAALQQPEGQRLWWGERHQRTSLWGGTVPCHLPSVKPASAQSGWWGEFVASESEAVSFVAPIPLERKKAGLLHWAAKAKSRSACLIRNHLGVSQRGRDFLNRIGQYPLLTLEELATVVGQTTKNVQYALEELERHSLIIHPASGEDGYMLTGQGLALVAAQSGYSPVEYAKLRRWPMRLDGGHRGKPLYSVDRLMTCREHTRLIVEFLVGLRRNGAHARMQLLEWDYVQCLQDSPFPVSSAQSRSRFPQTRVIPDAVGVVRVFDQTGTRFVDTDFWLEIDRNTERGQSLLKKLLRYYRVRGTQVGMTYSKPRLLLVIDPGSEARLQTFCQRLQALNKYYRVSLDARLTHVGLLKNSRTGKLDPTQRVWRTVESTELVYAFNSP